MTKLLIIPCRWRFRRCIVVDGNRKAEHMKMGKSNNDVRLTDGEGYFVRHGPYMHHLKTATESKPVSHVNIQK